MVEEGLITKASARTFQETLARLEDALRERGVKLFARVDHDEGAKEVGMDLRPTTVLIFGNPRGGTPLMQLAQSIGLELPLKILVFQDASGKTWVSYDDPTWLAQRFGLDPTSAPIAAMSATLAELTEAARRAATLG